MVVYNAGASPVVLGVVGAARIVPYILLSVPAGIAADRFDRRLILIVTDLARGAIMLALTALTLVNGPIFLIVGLSLLAACFSAFFSPAIGSLIPTLVTDETELGPANAAWSSLDNLAFIIGPAVAAILIALGSIPLAFFLNAVTFLVVAAVLWRLPRAARSREPVATDADAAGQSFREAVRPAIRPLSGLGLINLVDGFVSGGLAVLGRDRDRSPRRRRCGDRLAERGHRPWRADRRAVGRTDDPPSPPRSPASRRRRDAGGRHHPRRPVDRAPGGHRGHRGRHGRHARARGRGHDHLPARGARFDPRPDDWRDGHGHRVRLRPRRVPGPILAAVVGPVVVLLGFGVAMVVATVLGTLVVGRAAAPHLDPAPSASSTFHSSMDSRLPRWSRPPSTFPGYGSRPARSSSAREARRSVLSHPRRLVRGDPDQGSRQRPRFLRTLGPDEVFGEIGLLRGGGRTATVTAASDGALLVLDGQRFLELVNAGPSLTSRLLDCTRGAAARLEAPAE